MADASGDEVARQIEAVDEVLDELGCGAKDRLLLLNKVDRVNDPTVLTVLRDRHREAIPISAATGENADRLVASVLGRIRGRQVSVTLNADCANGRLMHYLSRYARVGERSYEGRNVTVEAVIGENHLPALRRFGAEVKVTPKSEAT